MKRIVPTRKEFFVLFNLFLRKLFGKDREENETQVKYVCGIRVEKTPPEASGEGWCFCLE